MCGCWLVFFGIVGVIVFVLVCGFGGIDVLSSVDSGGDLLDVFSLEDMLALFDEGVGDEVIDGVDGEIVDFELDVKLFIDSGEIGLCLSLLFMISE